MIKQILNHFNLNQENDLVREFNKDLSRDLNYSLSLKDISILKSNVFLFRVRTNPRAEYPEVNKVTVLLEKKRFIDVPVYSIENLKKHSEDLKLNIKTFEGNHGYGLAVMSSGNTEQRAKEEEIFQTVEIVEESFEKPISENKDNPISMDFVKDKLGYPKNNFKNNKPFKR